MKTETLARNTIVAFEGTIRATSRDGRSGVVVLERCQYVPRTFFRIYPQAHGTMAARHRYRRGLRENNAMNHFSALRRGVRIAVPVIIVTFACATAHAETGIASYYNGRYGRTAAMTCAHKTAPFGTHYKVTRLDGKGSVTCLVNDRGPYGKGFVIDLSLSAARVLGIIRSGIAMVSIEQL